MYTGVHTQISFFPHVYEVLQQKKKISSKWDKLYYKD